MIYLKKIILLLIGLGLVVLLNGQSNASITFSSVKNIEVELFKPMDGAYQNRSVSDILPVKPSVSVTYDFEVGDLSYIRLKISGRKWDIALFPGDKVKVHYVDDHKLLITGSNAAGQTYYNEHFRTSGTLFYINRLRDMALSSTDFSALKDELEQNVLRDHRDSLNHLYSEGKVTSAFLTAAQADLTAYFNYELFFILKDLHRNRELTDEQKAEALQEAQKLLPDEIVSDPNLMRYPLGYRFVGKYYDERYDGMAEEEKKSVVAGYDEDTFGPYIGYLLAPDHIRLPKFGSVFLIQLQFKANEFDLEKMYAYLLENYPESDYVAVITKEYKGEKTEKLRKKDDKVTFVTQSVSTLAGLSTLPALKGKYLMVDLWATWCLPCRKEFAEKERLNRILEPFTDLECVYLSIDEDSRAEAWKADVEKLKLYGYNLRAGKALIEDIKAKVYASGSIAIPRYLLISPSGKILDSNLPRPTEGKLLGETLRKLLQE